MFKFVLILIEFLFYILYFHRTLQNINEPGGGTRSLYGHRPAEKKARLSRSLTLPIFNFPGANAFVGRLPQQPPQLEAFKTSSSKYHIFSLPFDKASAGIDRNVCV